MNSSRASRDMPTNYEDDTAVVTDRMNHNSNVFSDTTDNNEENRESTKPETAVIDWKKWICFIVFGIVIMFMVLVGLLVYMWVTRNTNVVFVPVTTITPTEPPAHPPTTAPTTIPVESFSPVVEGIKVTQMPAPSIPLGPATSSPTFPPILEHAPGYPTREPNSIHGPTPLPSTDANLPTQFPTPFPTFGSLLTPRPTDETGSPPKYNFTPRPTFGSILTPPTPDNFKGER